jgi:hypothetical protein
MKGTRRRWGMAGVAAGLLTVLSGCVATGPGYGGDAGVYGGDYYEPDVYVYGGGWHPGYHVAPPRRGSEVHPPRAEAPARAANPAYRPAPSSRPAPSIPSRSRGR